MRVRLREDCVGFFCKRKKQPFFHTNAVLVMMVTTILLIRGSKGFVHSAPLDFFFKTQQQQQQQQQPPPNWPYHQHQDAAQSQSTTISTIQNDDYSCYSRRRSTRFMASTPMEQSYRSSSRTRFAMEDDRRDDEEEDDHDLAAAPSDIDDDETSHSFRQAKPKRPAATPIVISSDIYLPFSAEVAYDAFSDLTRQPLWSPWLRSVEYISDNNDNSKNETTIWKMKRFLGLSYSWKAISTLQDRPHVIAWESTQGLKNYGRVEFRPHPTSSSGGAKDFSYMKVSLSFVVPRVVSRFMGEQSRVAKFVRVRMVQQSLRNFRNVVLEEQAQQQQQADSSSSSSFSNPSSIADNQGDAPKRRLWPRRKEKEHSRAR